MTPLTWKALWAIGGSQYSLLPGHYLTDVPYEETVAIYRGDLLSTYASYPGDYRTFDVEPDLPSHPDRYRPKTGMDGPMHADAGLTAYLSALETRVGAVIEAKVPSNYSGYLWLDMEDWQPYWRRDFRESEPYDHLDGQYAGLDDMPDSLESVWRRYLAETVQDPLVTDYSSTTGAAREAMEDRFESRYIGVARPVHDTIYATVHAARPNAKVGEYAWPPRWLYDAVPPPAGSGRYEFYRAANAKFVRRMARNWDFLSPSFYPIHQAVPGTPTPPYEQNEADWTIFYTYQSLEFARVKSLCGGIKTFWFFSPHFNGGSAPLTQTMSTLTARLQLGMARRHKADGVIMWGIVSDAAALSRVEAGLDAMKPRLKNWVESVNGAYLSINSPIAIGPI